MKYLTSIVNPIVITELLQTFNYQPRYRKLVSLSTCLSVCLCVCLYQQIKKWFWSHVW